MLTMHEKAHHSEGKGGKMIEIGRLCVKIAGRDAGGKCVVVDMLGKGVVLIDGQVRRKKCNIRHLEPLNSTLPIKKGAGHDVVEKEFKKLGIGLAEKKAKTKESKPSKARAAPKKKEAVKAA